MTTTSLSRPSLIAASAPVPPAVRRAAILSYVSTAEILELALSCEATTEEAEAALTNACCAATRALDLAHAVITRWRE